MSEEVREKIVAFKERQMEKRKREREERNNLHAVEEVAVESTDMPAAKKRRKSGKKGDVKSAEMEALEARRAEEERRRKRPFKVPIEGELSTTSCPNNIVLISQICLLNITPTETLWVAVSLCVLLRARLYLSVNNSSSS